MAKRERVIQNLEKANTLLFGRSFEDFVFFLLVPQLIVIVLSMMEVMALTGLTLTSLSLVTIAIIIFRLADDSESALELVHSKHHRMTLPDHIPMMPMTDGGDPETTHPSPNAIEDITDDAESVPFWKADMDTTDLTGIQNVWPRYNAIQIEGGNLVGGLQITGTDLFLKGEQEEDQLITSLRNSLDNLETQIEFYVTTTPFNIDEFRNSQEMALNHDKIQDNTPLQMIAEGFQNQILGAEQLEEVYERELYLIANIDPSDSENLLTESTSYKEQLKAIINRDDDSEGPEFEGIELENLKTGLNVLQSELKNVQQRIDSIPEITTHPIAVEELLGVARGHFRGPDRKQPVEIPTVPLSTAVAGDE